MNIYHKCTNHYWIFFYKRFYSISNKSDTLKYWKLLSELGKVSEKENQATEQITDQRKAMLLKWREQRELKKKADAATKGQKSVFAVRHIQYNDNNPTLAPVGIKPNKKTVPKPKETIPEKRVTRSSARIANKQPTTPAATKVKSTVKDVVKAKKSSKQVSLHSYFIITRHRYMSESVAML